MGIDDDGLPYELPVRPTVAAVGAPTAPRVPPLRPPSGEDPPASVTMGNGDEIDLQPLAQEICRRYREEFPDERVRYGDAGQAWCLHDNLYLLSWAFDDAMGYLVMKTEVAWLAGVLEARDFPLERLARNLVIAADVLSTELPASSAGKVSKVLVRSATFVSTHGTFLG